MIIVRVKDLEGKVIDECCLGEGTHTIGRVPENTIVLKDMKVSRNHAEIQITGTKCTIKDLGSRTGTLVNKQQVQESEIRPGDQIALGDEILEIVPAEESLTEVKPTQIGRLTIIAPEDIKQNVFFLQKQDSTMGRVPECSIQVLDKQASREHSKVTFDGKHYFVEDMKSANGTTLNGRKITNKTILKVGDSIGIGSFRYKFDIINESEMKMMQEAQKAAALEEAMPEKPAAQKKAPAQAKSGSFFTKFVTFVVFVGIFGGGGYYCRDKEPLKKYIEKVKDIIYPEEAERKKKEEEDRKKKEEEEKLKNPERIPVSVGQMSKKTFRSYFEETGGIEPFQRKFLAASLEAEFKKVYVKDGQYVEKGKIVAILDDRYLQKDLDAANAQLEKAKSGEAGTQRVFDTTKEGMNVAKEHMNKMKKLFDQKVVPETNYTEAKTKYLQAKADNEKSGTELKTLQDEIKTVISKIDKLKERMKDTKMEANISGVVDQLTAKEGEFPRNPVMHILDISSVYAVPRISQADIVSKVWKEREIFRLDAKYLADLNVGKLSNELRKEFEQQKEIILSAEALVTIEMKDSSWWIDDKGNHRLYSIQKELGKLKVNDHQHVVVLSSAYPDVEFYGFVSEIETTVRESDRTCEVKVKVPNSDYKLKPGSFVKAKFLVGEKKDTPSIPKNAVITLANKKYVYVVRDVEVKDGKRVGKVQKLAVETGYEDDNFFELKSSASDIGWDSPIVVEGQLKLSDKDIVKIIE